MRRRNELQVEIRCYPKDDRAFIEDAESAVAASRETALRAERLLEAVQAKLRERYPSVQIRPREEIASTGLEEPLVLYCYRDGRVVA